MADRLGIHRREVGRLLGEMNERRDTAGLPDLGCIVVNKQTREVGEGWYGCGWRKGRNPRTYRTRAHENAISLPDN